MTPELAYFLKVNVALVLFYAFYRLFFYKDTFFKLRRSTLLIFFGLSIIYPLMNIQEWVKQQEPIAEVIVMYSAMLPEATIEESQTTINWQALFDLILYAGYWIGVVVFTIRFFIQLASILRLAMRNKRIKIQDTEIIALDKPTGPFSFFSYIFIHPESHSDKETEEILAHEKTHVSQWHSIDVILSEFVCIFCWINPFVWLLKREVRHNLEYLADNTVIQLGFDSKSYQYHLLGLAHHHQAAANLYNSFNVLHLKNRISMMNKKRTNGFGKMKYLIFIPIIAILLIISNIDEIARMTKKLTGTPEPTKDNTTITINGLVVDEADSPISAAAVTVKDSDIGTISNLQGRFKLEAPANSTLHVSDPGMESKEVVVEKTSDIKVVLKRNTSQPEKFAFTVVEQMPQYPGGESELLKFIAKNIKYPQDAQNDGIEGRVIITFIVNEDGTVSDPVVVRGVSPSLDKEAIRVIGLMPKWTPGKQKGKDVPVKFTVPITYRLSDGGNDSSTQVIKADNQQNDKTIFKVVEQMPQFPGGEDKLLKFISNGIVYPKEAQEKGLQGRVVCTFVINKDGTISDTKVVKGEDPLLDKEAIRVIETMPKWIPGKQRGQNVAVAYTLPITFKLQ